MPSEKLRRMGKVGLMIGFGLCVFAIVFYVSLPYARFKDFLAGQLAGFGYDMEAKHAGPSLSLGMTLREVSLVSHPSGGGKPTRILIDKATLGVSLVSYLFGTKSFNVSANVFAGDIDVKVKMGKKDSAAQASATEIDLAEIPWVKSAINLPLSGKFGLKLDLGLPNQRPSEAKGTLTWTCTSCAVGDGKAKLVIASNPLLAEGLGLPKIRLGDFTGKLAMDKGVGRLQNIQFKSQDLEATVEGEIHLAQPLATSHVDLYVRFKLSDSLLRSSEKLRTIMDFTAQMGKRPDGFIGFRISGSFQNMSNVEWLKTSPFASTSVPAKPAPPVRGALPPPLPPAPPSPPVVSAQASAAAPPPPPPLPSPIAQEPTPAPPPPPPPAPITVPSPAPSSAPPTAPAAPAPINLPPPPAAVGSPPAPPLGAGGSPPAPPLGAASSPPAPPPGGPHGPPTGTEPASPAGENDPN